MIRKIINLILSKLYKKSDTAQLAELFIPDYSATPATVTMRVTQENSSEGAFAVFTAPFDSLVGVGFSVLEKTSITETNTSIIVNGGKVINDSEYWGTLGVSTVPERWGCHSIFVRKGEQIAAGITHWSDSVSPQCELVATFYPLVGGEHPDDSAS